MDRPLRVLTVGVKPSLNEALAAREDLRVAALDQLATERHSRGPLEVLPYRRRPKVSPAAARVVSEAIAEFRPDLVQTYGSRPLAHAVLAMSGRRNRPKLLTYRGVTSVPSRLRAEDWLTYLAPTVDAHACESVASMEGLLRAGVPAGRCFVTYNNLTRTPRRAESRAGLAELGVPPDAFVVAMVANFRRVKGGDILLEAARRLRDLPDVYFVLLGEARDGRLRRLARDPAIAPQTRLAGFRTDAMDLASTADLFVMPSRAEALCVALLEAMSLGVCPVVSDAGGMKEAVRDGVDGLVVPRRSPEALAAAIRELYSDRGRIAAYGVSACQRFAARFSDEAVAARFAAAYVRLIGPGARPGAFPVAA